MGLRGPGRFRGVMGEGVKRSAPGWWRLAVVGMWCSLAGFLNGCRAGPEPIAGLVAAGEFGRARVQVSRELTRDMSDRRYLLDRMRLSILTLADGYPEAADPVFSRLYEVLRTQGINQDKTVASVVINEDIKLWKGEPFEQALAMFYYAAQQAMLGEWENARAAAGDSLFRLRDFGTDEQGRRIDTLEIVRRAMAYERGQAQGTGAGPAPSSPGEGGDYLNTGYAVRESNFTLGYLTCGLANLRIGREQEARDYFAVAVEIDPQIKPLCDQLLMGRYNTVLFVGYGLGPRKVAYGPDYALARFIPTYESDEARLVVSAGDQLAGVFPVVCDVNAMAADHMWNNLEDVRLAKSQIGSVLLLGGLVAAGAGQHYRSEEAVYAGLGAAVLGLFAKAGAHADTRYCDVMPQRVYVAPVLVESGQARIVLQVEGRPESRLVLVGLRPPPNGQVQARYVQMVSAGGADGSAAPAWAVSGRVEYGNDAVAADIEPRLPYVLGGRCVRVPSEAVFQAYRRAGYFRGMTRGDLEDAYRAEGIRFSGELAEELDTDGSQVWPGLHVLEGGRSLIAPWPGTTGFARLFGQVHPPYQARSEQLRRLEKLVRSDGMGLKPVDLSPVVE